MVAIRSGRASCRRATDRSQAASGRRQRTPQRLMQLMTNEPNPNGLRHFYTKELIHARPEALVEADPDPERTPR